MSCEFFANLLWGEEVLEVHGALSINFDFWELIYHSKQLSSENEQFYVKFNSQEIKFIFLLKT